MALRGKSPPAVARVILQPLGADLKKRKRGESEEKEEEVKQPSPIPDLRVQAAEIAKICWPSAWTQTRK